MKYELSQAGYRDFLNTAPGYLNNILPERSDLTSSNYQSPGTKLFPFFYRNYLAVATGSSTNPVGSNANANTTYNEADDGEWIAANFLFWSDAAAFLDWAALRPMTEFEYEKAVNGPDAITYPQFASGTYIQVPNISTAGILNAITAAETVTTTNQNQKYLNTNEFWGTSTNGTNTGQPLRSGFSANATSTRLSSAGSYYGVIDLSGNLWEPVVTVANAAGRSFTGQLGDGSISGLNGQANENSWPGVQNDPTLPNVAGQVQKLYTAGISKRGGSFADNLFNAVTDVNYNPAIAAQAYPTTRGGVKSYGCRGVRQVQ